MCDHLGDGHLCRRTMQTLWQRQGNVVGTLGPGAEDDGLGVGEFRHDGVLFNLMTLGGIKRHVHAP
jgi:hypothetical protein